MRKKICLLAICVILLFSAKTQSIAISPSVDSEVCPGTDITFTVTFTGKNITSIAPKALNIAPVVAASPSNINHTTGIVTFTFVGRFIDWNDKQTFTMHYVDINDQGREYDFTFKKIKSFKILGDGGAGDCSKIRPAIPSTFRTANREALQ